MGPRQVNLAQPQLAPSTYPQLYPKSTTWLLDPQEGPITLGAVGPGIVLVVLSRSKTVLALGMDTSREVPELLPMGAFQLAVELSCLQIPDYGGGKLGEILEEEEEDSWHCPFFVAGTYRPSVALFSLALGENFGEILSETELEMEMFGVEKGGNEGFSEMEGILGDKSGYVPPALALAESVHFPQISPKNASVLVGMRSGFLASFGLKKTKEKSGILKKLELKLEWVRYLGNSPVHIFPLYCSGTDGTLLCHCDRPFLLKTPQIGVKTEKIGGIRPNLTPVSTPPCVHSTPVILPDCQLAVMTISFGGEEIRFFSVEIPPSPYPSPNIFPLESSPVRMAFHKNSKSFFVVSGERNSSISGRFEGGLSGGKEGKSGQNSGESERESSTSVRPNSPLLSSSHNLLILDSSTGLLKANLHLEPTNLPLSILLWREESAELGESEGESSGSVPRERGREFLVLGTGKNGNKPFDLQNMEDSGNQVILYQIESYQDEVGTTDLMSSNEWTFIPQNEFSPPERRKEGLVMGNSGGIEGGIKWNLGFFGARENLKGPVTCLAEMGSFLLVAAWCQVRLL